LRVDRPHFDFDGDPSGLGASARTAAAALASLRDDLAEGARGRQKDLTSLRTQALERLPADSRPESDEIDAIAAAATELRTARRDESVRLSAEADRLADQLEQKRALEKSVAGKKAQRDLYTQLAAELRTDRIVDFLQAEALTTLAVNGSLHLEDLSDHRYRLGFENDRFFVIDAWNADERRSVRTLSGGETFLASLALALALAEGVQMLAVTQKSRLESLFLDEGFGTLDDETLKAVVDALERLGSSDRLVGVITHVAALADEMPVRVEVSKSQRGSTLQITTRDPGAPI
jgi:exonuclease SbcC